MPTFGIAGCRALLVDMHSILPTTYMHHVRILAPNTAEYNAVNGTHTDPSTDYSSVYNKDHA